MENKEPSNAKEEQLEEVMEETTEAVDGQVEETSTPSMEEQLAEAEDKYKRIAAEYYNYRERTSREKANMFHDGVRDTIEKLLPVIDNLERAVAAQQDKEDAFYKGVEMTLKNFKEILTAMGVEEIPAVGEKFDPSLHAAVSHIEDENFGENEISIEMMKGYKYKDKVIRHSMVQVAN